MSHLVAMMDSRSQLHLRDGALEVRRGAVVLETLRPHQLRELQVWGNATLTASARNLLMREGVDVVYLTADGRYRGRLVSAESRQGQRRAAQYAFLHDPARRLALARAVVRGKLANQRWLLLARQRSLRDEGIADVLVALRASMRAVDAAAELDVLRGVEGAGARRYFAGLARALTNPAFRFGGRNRYPPRDPVNACLSFGYTLALTQVEHAVRASGLDPYLGALHEAGRGATCLALDLVEELRPAVDGLVLTLLNRRQLSPEDFRRPLADELGAKAELEGEAVYLGDVGRRVLLREWERTLGRVVTHPVREDRWSLRDAIREQSRQVARWFEGDAEGYVPLSWGKP
ncbi:MAG: CRISPR-associated endonuclease Cas1 [Alphaproteobacteria bacterium]|nr:CRISPR-associated endonuclease Cas1 [Alphaproteobacteria bacterium]